MSTKIALVTGAGSGIGRAVSLALQKAGYSVVLAGRREEEAREKTAAMAGADGDAMLPVRSDVSQPESVQELFARTKEAFGRLDLLFNNAGISTPAPLDGRSHVRTVDVGCQQSTSPESFLCAQEAIRMMKDAESARRPHHQQRLDLGPCRRGPIPRRTPPPNTPSPDSPSPSRSTAASTTSPAARSTSATPRPK